jgi:hypothetical protein
MGCRRAWSREVIDSILLTTWINGDYKKHREDILFDRERSRLPACQIIVERRKMANERTSILTDLQQKITALENQLSVLRGEYYHECRVIQTLQRGGDPFAAISPTAPQEERRVFIMPCPASGCRGFLSQAYKCGVCDIHVCSECREVKGATRDAEHTCNADTVATVQRLKKECRGCPECGTSIFKIEGCDQMFCTHCNTPFSWTTGKKIVNGAIHNPHYFEYLKAVNGGVMPRAPGDIPCIANLPNAWTFERDITRKFGPVPAVTDFLYTALNKITHIQHVEIPHMTTAAEDSDNTEYNVRYLLGEIDQKRWKQSMQQKEKRRIKKDEIRMRYEAFVGACVDIYGRIMRVPNHTMNRSTNEIRTSVHDACKEAKVQLLAMRIIFNEGMMEISKRYKCQVLQLSDINLKHESKKYQSGRTRAGDDSSETTTVVEE